MSDSALPLSGLRVLELASEWTAFTGWLLAGMGANVVVVEPLTGSDTRTFGPFVDDVVDRDRSLWWRYYNSGKRGFALDLDYPLARVEFDRLLARADLIIEAEPHGRLKSLSLNYEEVSQTYPHLLWLAISPFGHSNARNGESVTDLTLMAGGGPVWSCGYDDHELPPVRPGEGHAAHIGGYYAVVGALVALIARENGVEGQLIDVSLHAALNVTTEGATFEWLVARETVQRQTGRHAQVEPTQRTQTASGDGNYVNTGVPRPDAASCQALLSWLEELDLLGEVEDLIFLKMAASGELDSSDTVLLGELLGTQRTCLILIAQLLPGYDFFIQAQERGLSGAIIQAVEDVVCDSHLRSRGMWVPVDEEAIGRSVLYPRGPLQFEGDNERCAPAPNIGQHNADILADW